MARLSIKGMQMSCSGTWLRILQVPLLASSISLRAADLGSGSISGDAGGRTDLSLYLAVINDNFTGTQERGEAGKYFGPDDFLTVSIFIKAEVQDWRFGFTYNNVTSRKYEYRYDLLFAGLARTYQLSGFKLRPELGLVWKGDCSGDELQNWYHRRIDIPELHVPYKGKGVGTFTAATLSKPLRFSQPFKAVLTTATELRLVSGLVPSRLTPMLGYQLELIPGSFQMEMLLGARFYLNDVPGYSDFIRSGPFGGVNAKLRVLDQLYFDLGVSLFPARNLENDPIYLDKDHGMMPQITLVFSWNSQWSRLYDYLEY